MELSSCSKEKVLGKGYAPIVGTWRLVQRNVFDDSTSVSTPKIISNTSPQTITFNNDGSMSSVGKETEYYRSSKYYKVDSTTVGLKLGLILDKIYPAFYQGLVVRTDTLILVPCGDKDCNLTLIKSR